MISTLDDKLHRAVIGSHAAQDFYEVLRVLPQQINKTFIILYILSKCSVLRLFAPNINQVL